MQGWSRMAALTIVASLALAFDTHARAADPVVVPKVRLDLAIAGLGRDGCDVEIKPGHSGCRFRAETHHVDSSGKLSLTLKDVEVHSADRDCAFAITIKESGHAERTVHRGLRVSPPSAGKTTPVPSLTCLVSSPSKIARAEASRARR